MPSIPYYNSIVGTQVQVSGENVGIGTATPAYKLDVSGTGNIASLKINDQYSFPTGVGSVGDSLVYAGSNQVAWSGVSGGGTDTNTFVTGISYNSSSHELTLTRNNGSVTGVLSNVIHSGDNISLLVNDAGYITGYTETDPIFTGSVAYNITSLDTGNWNSAYDWVTNNSGTILSSGDNVSLLVNDANYAASGDNVSLFVNDAGYLTEHPAISDAATDSDNSGRTYIQDILLDSYGHVTGIATATETVTDTDTTYTAGSGLSLVGTTFHANVDSTTQSVAPNSVSSTASRTYAVQVDSSDNLVVNVPWVDTDTTVPLSGQLTGDIDMNGYSITGVAGASGINIDGNITAEYFYGDLDGVVITECRNGTASTISEGTPVYVSGYYSSNGKPLIAEANASSSSTMPAIGLLASDLASGAEGHIHVFGLAQNLPSAVTNGFSVGETVYVAAGGGLTNVRPTGVSELVQNMGRVLKTGTNGRILVLGPGRSNDVPNSGHFEQLTVDGQTILAKDGGNVGIGTATPAYKLDVNGTINSAKLEITNTSTDDSLLITTTEDSSTAAPVLTFKRNSSSPVNGDYLGQLKFKGENDADQEVVYAKVTAKISDVTDTTEDGLFEFALRKAGSNNIGMRLTSTELKLLNGTEMDMGSQQIHNVLDPTSAQDAATKNYVDSNHITISAASSVDNSNGSVIQDITLDTNGHVTALGSIDLDSRYYTESEIDAFNYVDGNGTASYLPKWSDTDTLTNSVVYDDGTNIGIGTNTPSVKLDVAGAINSTLASNNKLVVKTNSVIGKLQAYDATSSVYAGAESNHHFVLRSNNTDRLTLYNTNEGVWNEYGLNYDFRVEGSGDANLLFTDASTDRVGIGTATPQAKLDVNGTVQFDDLVRWEYPDKLLDASISTLGYMRLYDEVGAYCGLGVSTSSFNIGTSGAINVRTITGGVERSIIDTNGNFVFNELGNNCDFRIEGNGETHLFQTDANQKTVGIGQSNPSYKLYVKSSNTSLDQDGVFIRGVGVDPAVMFMGADTNESYITAKANGVLELNADIYDGAGGSAITFNTDNVEAMRVDYQRRVGIGTATPSATLDVVGDLEVSETITASGCPVVISNTGIATGSDVINNIVSLTEAEYFASTIDEQTLYVVTDASSSTDISTVDGRLTLQSGTSVPSSNQTSKTTLYFTPHKGNQIAVYDGTSWSKKSFAEISLSLSGYAADTNFDIFIYDNSGTLTLESTAWTNDTTRATALTTQNGVYVKSGATTRRYLGTIRTTATTGQCEDSTIRRFVWNYYNREIRIMSGYLDEGGGNHTYSGGSWRAYNNSTSVTTSNGGTRVELVIGINSPIHFHVNAQNKYGYTGISYDTTTAITTHAVIHDGTNTGSGMRSTASDIYDLSAGFHYLQVVQNSVSTNTATFYWLQHRSYLRG